MVGLRSVEPVDGKLVGYGEKPDFGIYPPARYDPFGDKEEKLAGWSPAIDQDGSERVRLRFHDDLEWSGAGADGEHIVWSYQ